MALPETWHIRSRSGACSVSGIAFVEGQLIITAIFPDSESQGYLRKDFSIEAWRQRANDGDIPFSHWQTTYSRILAEEAPQAVTKQGAEELLRTLVEADQEHTENTRYILAIMLERQKLLRETDSQASNSGTLRVYEHRKTGEVFIVRDPSVPLDQIEKIQEEVMSLLSLQPSV